MDSDIQYDALMNRTIAILAFSLVACGKDAKPSSSAEGSGAAKPTAAAKQGNFKPLEGIGADLEVEVPADAEPIGTIPGFQNADKTFKFVARSVGGSPDHADAAALKASMSSSTVKEWLKDEKLPDGYYAIHTMDKVETYEAEDGALKSKVVGTEYSMLMRRQIGDTWYSCSCILPRQELLDAVIKACKSIRKAGG